MASSKASRTPDKANLIGWLPKLAAKDHHAQLFNPLTATAYDLQRLLTAGRLKSIDLLDEYYCRIQAHNGYLNAVYELAPGAIARAEEMDAKRANGEFLGPLHGIPILIKDNIATHPNLGMGTTAGALALVGSEPQSNATIIDRLLDAGAILLGKSILSELSWGEKIRCGWSALAGQAQNAYVRGGDDPNDGVGGFYNCGGSSAGSAIAISAGLTPLAIGTETEGSLVNPAARASLYTMKPTRGLVPNNGIIPVTHRYDIAGPMAKSVKDVADVLTVLVDPAKTTVPEGGYASAIGNGDSWSEIRVGTLDPEKWHYDEVLVKPIDGAMEQMVREIRAAYDRVKSMAKAYYEDVDLRLDVDFEYEGQNALFTMMMADFKTDMDGYLGSLKHSKVTNLRELVEWNAAHAEEAITLKYPNQALLEQSLNFDKAPEQVAEIFKHTQDVGKSFNDTIAKYDLDVIIGPGDSWLSKYSTALGCPIAAMPLSYLDLNGRPFGLMIAAPSHQDAMLIKVMSAFEATFPARKPPTAYMDAESHI